MAENKKDERKGDGLLGDTIKRIVSIGVGGAFMTEEAVRKILDDLPLPKDIVTGLIANAKNAKSEFTEGIREEIRSYLSRVDPEVLMNKLVDKYDIEIEAKLKFKKKEQTEDVVKSDEQK